MSKKAELKLIIRGMVRQARVVSLVAALPVAYASTVVAQDAAPGGLLEEITVTATRRSVDISKVPISITAMSQEQMDQQGLKKLDDLVKFTPGLNVGGNNQSNISIRGIASTAGAATTGVYIDDTPIQVRRIGGASGTALPALFDLERVEVLRGPQGTLFGSGSEGGTIRFIQVSPGLQKYSGYARAELSTTEGGDPSYETGVAFGGPIIEDRLGFRVSTFYRREGGYIDAVEGTYTINDSRGRLHADSINWTTTDNVRPDSNWNTTMGARAALKWLVTDSLTLTPSVFYQKVHQNDGDNTFMMSGSDPDSNSFIRQVYTPGPVTAGGFTQMDAPIRNEGDDKFVLPALLAEWSVGGIDLVSNTSYFERKATANDDFTTLYEALYTDLPYVPGDAAPTTRYNRQHLFTQELRAQSNEPNARLNWVVGLFFSDSSQYSLQRIEANFLQQQSSLSIVGDPRLGFTDGSPFGPGSSAFLNYFGVPLMPGSVTWRSDFSVEEKQKAAFAQLDFKITERLKLTAGIRFAKNSLGLDATYTGAENNLNYAAGRPCDTGPVCTPDTGTFTVAYPVTKASQDETSTTPKIGLTYDINDDNMIYTTVAKGFRPAGAQLLAPVSQCAGDLAEIGYLDADGNSTQPQIYKSDSVWSYEIGSKNRVLGGRVTIDASAYQIRWSNIQTSIPLPICAYGFIDNVGNATSQGVDLAVRGQAAPGLVLAGTLGYNHTRFDENVDTPNGETLFGKNSGVPGAPAPIRYSLQGDYDFTLAGDKDFYTHIDFTHSNEERQAGRTSPTSASYNPLYWPVEAFSTVNLRLGMRVFNGADISLFVNNLTNEHPDLGISKDQVIWSNSTLLSRTFGATVTYRY